MARPQLASPCCTAASWKDAASAAHHSHPVCKNRRKGATQKAKCGSMCLRPAKIAQITAFYQRRWQLRWSKAAWCLLNLNVAGCTVPICHPNNRHVESYVTLATDDSLVSWSTVGPRCETQFLWCFLHHLNVCLFLRVTIILFWWKELAWQSDISTDFLALQKPWSATEIRKIKQVHDKNDHFKWHLLHHFLCYFV